MGKVYREITPALAEWLCQQRLFFVATAPLAANGHINCSPKGGDCFRMLDPLTVAYQDLTGSGAETIAHLRENGRLVMMFCAFEGPPQIVRLHGVGEVLTPEHPDFAALISLFSPHPGLRSIVRLQITRISDSCGYGVPLMQFQAERDNLHTWAKGKGPERLVAYRRQKNQFSIDGLPALVEATDEPV
ncbi:MAG: pyridoxamine 5'-phosphate oxidase family protein [Leptolyngbyaceae cyanobacterium SM2_5_2]|nr:pyridoxamine 5'-phosphate oxidase family protein [Leptolyngbyaceae cyanobacterium SM2_5_2]